jgi:nucleoside-diphosphate-sugar epimerase
MVPEPSGPYPHFILAYYASKFKAHKAALNFISTQHPAYEITQVYPSFVIGKNELASSTDALVQGSNALLYSLLLSGQGQMSLEGATVHVDDVAYTHVRALDPNIEGNQKFLCTSGGLEGSVWDDASEIVARRFPGAVKDGVLPLGGSQATTRVSFDTSKTREVLGFEFKGWEEQVVSAAGWYIEVARKMQG